MRIWIWIWLWVFGLDLDTGTDLGLELGLVMGLGWVWISKSRNLRRNILTDNELQNFEISRFRGSRNPRFLDSNNFDHVGQSGLEIVSKSPSKYFNR